MKLPFELKDIKPGSFSYITKRKLESSGEIFLWKERGSEESHYVMRCPFCKKEQSGSVVLIRRPYRVRCSDCGRSIALPKIVDQAKKETKAAGK